MKKFADRGWRLGTVFKAGMTLAALLTIGGAMGCSIPNMQSPQCSEASDSVKEFYSWYLGTDADKRQPEMFTRFLVSDFSGDRNADKDPFYLATTAPTTFKVGKCEPVDDSHANVQVQLYWRHSDQNTEQREIYADSVKTGENWKIAKIEDR